jgi:acyl-CoA synthetase (AMP-forming)/AMP-acid ligase II
LLILPDRWGDALGPWTTEDMEALALPPGQPGEIVVSGDHVLPGYLDGAGDSESKIHVDGRVWHRTGDAGYLDDRGRLWLLGRCSARVNDSHGVLYPFAVEAAASGTPGLARAAFVMDRGRRVLVAEVAGEAEGTKQRLLERLAWARVGAVVIVDRIPLDARHNAKVDYPALRRLLGG